MDDHCWIRMGGQDVHIVAMYGPDYLEVASTTGERALVDLSGMRWDEYIAACVALLEENWR